MSSRYINIFRFFFVCVDMVALSLVHIWLIVNFRGVPADGDRPYGLLILVSNIIWLISTYSVALYVEDAHPDAYRFSKRTIKAFILFSIGILIFVFAYHYPYSRLFILIDFIGFFLFLAVTRIAMILIFSTLKKTNRNTKRIVVVGYNEIAKNFVETFSFIRKDFHVDGYFEDSKKIAELSNLPIIGSIETCIDYAVRNHIHEIYSTISPEKNENIYAMAKLAERSFIRFKFIPDFKLYVNRETFIEYQGNFPILSLRPEPLEEIGNSIKKRLFDIVFSLLVVVLILTWLIPLLGLLIMLTSRGGVFFKQKRSGKNNVHFTCYKLRTMTMNKEANSIQVTLNDARVTKIGRFLRKTNLDELPQFVNVLLGNMSVIGPRPHMLVHTKMYSKILNEYMIRHFLKPGITGWAQVNGCRGEIKDEGQLSNRIAHDIWYMENWSIWLDLKIIWLTIFNTLRGDKNAY
jgi:putative colanic acid biosysnthesis UDP-glucose lipid carrier transferase